MGYILKFKGCVAAFFLLLGCSSFAVLEPLKEDPVQVRFNFNFIAKGNVKLPANFGDTLKKVNVLLDQLFSSQEFKDSLSAHSFNDSTYSKVKNACFVRDINANTHRIDGRNVYDNLTADKVINLDLLVQETLKKTSTQGFSNACSYKITSNDYWMGENQPLAYRYVRHIAHEFTHIRGYRHDTRVEKEYKWGRSPNEDPAYGVGKIAGNILQRWSKSGIAKI